jgi:hypothetical protein
MRRVQFDRDLDAAVHYAMDWQQYRHFARHGGNYLLHGNATMKSADVARLNEAGAVARIRAEDILHSRYGAPPSLLRDVESQALEAARLRHGLCRALAEEVWNFLEGRHGEARAFEIFVEPDLSALRRKQ